MYTDTYEYLSDLQFHGHTQYTNVNNIYIIYGYINIIYNINLVYENVY